MVTCRVLSNQRLALFHRLPPPCSIWMAAELRYVCSDSCGITPSIHRVKMLLWMVDTEALLVASAYKRENVPL